MVTTRGGIYWADLGPARGSKPAKRRPVVVIQDDRFNSSQLATVLAAVVTSNTALAARPGNTFLPSSATGLPRDSVANVSALVTLNKTDLTEQVGSVPAYLRGEIDAGLRLILNL
jgi:mRNA interferase MazF